MSLQRNTYAILAHSDTSLVTKESIDNSAVFVTTNGLVKESNEDFLGYRQGGSCIVIAIADGHWGDDAARKTVEHLLSLDDSDYGNTETLREVIARLQDVLFEAYATNDMQAETTKTPETSLLLAIIDTKKRQGTFVGYGDCRAIVLRDTAMIYEYATVATWLGAFSKVGMRDRLPVDEALSIETINLAKNDRILLYTDGIDESVYETPTTDVATFVSSQHHVSVRQLADSILTRVFDTGAEDNASLAIIDIP